MASVSRGTFDGLSALVTGAARGIGHAVVVELARGGSAVTASDNDEQAMSAAAKLLQDDSLDVTGTALDVRDTRAVDRAVDDHVRRNGRLDVLVNCAGIGQRLRSVSEMADDDWLAVMDVNFFGTMRCCRSAANVMMHQEGGGRIVNIASINGLTPAPLASAYNASKAAIISLTRTLALELAHAGVRVNAVCPGPVYTELNKPIVAERAEGLGLSVDAMCDRIRDAIPLGRWGEPVDISASVAFLCSDAASWITGETLVVSGGMSAVPASSRPSALEVAGKGSD